MAALIHVRSIEYPIVEHCNLCCAYCDHASPLLSPKFATLSQYRRDLKAASRVLSAGQLMLLGGEPLLHPRLIDFFETARAVGVAEKLTLITNGTLLHRVDPKLWEVVDRIWLSVYPGVPIRLTGDELKRICEEHNIVLDRHEVTHFRRTLTTRKIGDPAAVQRIFDGCKLAHEWCCYTIHDGYFYKCAPAPFMEQPLRGLGSELANRTSDGIELDSRASLRDELLDYLDGRTPVNACSYCLGSSGVDVQWHQSSRRLLKMVPDNEPPVASLIDARKMRRASIPASNASGRPVQGS